MDTPTLTVYLPLILKVVSTLATRLPAHVDREELEAAALVGLWQATQHYDPAKGRFAAYARCCMNGAMLDWLRRTSRLTRTERAAGVPEPLSLTVVRERGKSASGGFLIGNDEWHPADPTREPLEVLATGEDAVEYLLRPLSAKRRQAVRLRYLDGLRFHEVGRRMGISETGAWWLVKHALAQLRAETEVTS